MENCNMFNNMLGRLLHIKYHFLFLNGFNNKY